MANNRLHMYLVSYDLIDSEDRDDDYAGLAEALAEWGKSMRSQFPLILESSPAAKRIQYSVWLVLDVNEFNVERKLLNTRYITSKDDLIITRINPRNTVLVTDHESSAWFDEAGKSLGK